MPAKTPRDSAISPMCDLFGEPPLLKGEDKERYLRLLALVEDQIGPKTIFEEMLVRDLTEKYWEQQRCKQSCASLVEGAYIDALASLLGPFFPPRYPLVRTPHLQWHGIITVARPSPKKWKEWNCEIILNLWRWQFAFIFEVPQAL